MQEDWVRTELWNASSNQLIKEGSSNIVFWMITYLYTPQIVLFLNQILKRRQFVFLHADSLKVKWATNTALPKRSRKRKISVSVLLALLLPHGTMSARDQNRHLNLRRLASFSPLSSCGSLSPGAVRTWVWTCLEAGVHKPGEMGGKKCGHLEGFCVPWAPKKCFELLNCGLPWGEVQAGLLSYSAEIKLKANPASKWWSSSFTPLIFAERTGVECEVKQGTILCPFFTGLNNHASCKEIKCSLQ